MMPVFNTEVFLYPPNLVTTTFVVSISFWAILKGDRALRAAGCATLIPSLLILFKWPFMGPSTMGMLFDLVTLVTFVAIALATRQRWVVFAAGFVLSALAISLLDWTISNARGGQGPNSLITAALNMFWYYCVLGAMATRLVEIRRARIRTGSASVSSVQVTSYDG